MKHIEILFYDLVSSRPSQQFYSYIGTGLPLSVTITWKWTQYQVPLHYMVPLLGNKHTISTFTWNWTHYQVLLLKHIIRYRYLEMNMLLGTVTLEWTHFQVPLLWNEHTVRFLYLQMITLYGTVVGN